jgi:hypothetical protein
MCLGAIRSAVECKAAIFAVVAQMFAPAPPPIAAETIADIALYEQGGGGDWAIHDDCTREHRCSIPYKPRSLDEALSIAHQLDAAGHRWSGGLTQIERENFGWLGINDVAQIFDPRVAIAAEVQFLTSLSRYNTGDPWRGLANGYVQKVLAQRHVAVGPELASPESVQKVAQNDGTARTGLIFGNRMGSK